MNLNNNETEIPEDQPEEYALKLGAKDFACRSKAKAKPQKREPAGSSPRIVPLGQRNWIDIEPGNHSLSLCVRGFEESSPSSPTFSTSTSRRRWSNSFLENEGKSSESIHTIKSLVWRSMESMFGRRRRSKKEIPVLVDLMDKNHKYLKVIDLNVPCHAQYSHNALKRHQDAIYWVDINLAQKKGLKFFQTRSNAIILQETLPAYSIPKVVRMKTGEVLYETVYMSPRPPSKILFKHEWKRELGSEHAQRSEVGHLSGSFQSNQTTLNPIRESSGRPDSTQDGRKTSRSPEIDVNSFGEEPSSSERTGRLVEINVYPTRSPEDRKDFNVEQTRERTGRPVNTHDVTNLTDSSQTRSAHESETFNVEDGILRKRKERSVADHDVSHESMMVNEADMDFRIPGLPHSVVKHAQSTSVRELIQKIENHPGSTCFSIRSTTESII